MHQSQTPSPPSPTIMNDHNAIAPYNSHQSPHPPPPPLSPKKKKSGIFHDRSKNINLGEGIDLAIGVTATALTADQLLKLKDSKKHKTMHLAKAGLCAAAAATAFTMMRREHNERVGRQRTRQRSIQGGTEAKSAPGKDEEHECQSVSSSRSSSQPRSFERRSSRSRSRSRSPPYPYLEVQEPGDHKVRWALVPSPPPEEEHQEDRGESSDDYRYVSSRLAPPSDEMHHQRGRARTLSPAGRQEDGHRRHHRRRKLEGQSKWHTFFDLLSQELRKQRRS